MADNETPGPGHAIVRSQEETRAALQRVVHGKASNEEVYWCMSCGFCEDASDPSKVRYPKGLTLQFTEEEIEALGGDLSAYTGPCPCCDFMSLVPMDRFQGSTIAQRSRENRDAEYKQQAQAFVGVVKDELTKGSIFHGGMAGAAQDAEPEGTDDLPDADQVDDADLKPREPA